MIRFATKKTLILSIGMASFTVIMLSATYSYNCSVPWESLIKSEENSTVSIVETVEEYSNRDWHSAGRSTRHRHDPPKCREKVFLRVIVLSAPENILQRNAIRTAWANSLMFTEYFKVQVNKDNSLSDQERSNSQDLKFLGNFSEPQIKVVFVIGEVHHKHIENLIRLEAEAFDDIVFSKYPESYKHITAKTISGMKWAHKFCPGTYVMKTDDDVFVNLRLLIKWLYHQPRVKLYGGVCDLRGKPHREPQNKQYISKQDYPDETYPPFCAGGGYVISEDILERLYNGFNMTSFFPYEDVYIGMMIKQYYPTEVTQMPKCRWYYDQDGVDTVNMCNIFLLHSVKHYEQVQFSEREKATHKLCVS